MEQLIERCCGLDVHRDTVAACVRVPGPGGRRTQTVQTFGTTAADLLALRDWLEAQGVTHVAMESTGVSWKTRLLRARGELHGPPGQRGSSQARPGPED
jgi:transposase